MTKQRPRRVGLGMKPREYSGTQGVSNHAEEKHLGYVSTTPSVAVGREEAPIEGEIEAVSGIAEGGNHDFSSRQNSDSTGPEVGEEVSISPKAVESAPIVARNTNFIHFSDVSEHTIDSLEEMLKASEKVTELDPRDYAGIETSRMITFEEAAKMGLPPVEGADGYSIFNGKQYAIGIDKGIGEDHGAASVIRLGENGDPDELVETLGMTTLGELPNGEYRSTVRVGEGYIEGIKAQAEADGQSLEDWLTFQLQERLEQWFFAAGAR